MQVPISLGVIPDGNRRFAKRLLENPSKGHEWGAGKLRKLLGWCKELGIRNVTVYALSLENLHKRGEQEIGFLLDIARREISDIIKPGGLAHENGIRLSFFGSLHLLPQDLQGLIREAQDATRHYEGHTLSIAIAYGGRQELVSASREIALKTSQGSLTPDEVDELVLRQNLQTNGNPDPDLIIRTGGEKRISNFLIFQAAYSELAFTDTFWPDLTREEFFRIIEDYSRRQRRFGK